MCALPQSYVDNNDLADLFDASPLAPYLYLHQDGADWPKLGALIDAGKRVMVLSNTP